MNDCQTLITEVQRNYRITKFFSLPKFGIRMIGCPNFFKYWNSVKLLLFLKKLGKNTEFPKFTKNNRIAEYF